jgi:hypothetical protein
MENLRIETERLIITEFNESMIQCVHLNSLDEDNRRFVPDEVFETVENARKIVLERSQYFTRVATIQKPALNI